jgi:ubiquinone/menaquinone biosynthesis C-methylase UbiE
VSDYDSIAALYDPWSVTVVEDIPFYVALAEEAGGPVVELGVGTGRVAIPTAQAGIPVIGVDSSLGMLQVAAARAEENALARGRGRRASLALGEGLVAVATR